MFWVEKADHSSPGFRWRVTKSGNITGRVYQTWPHRLKARFKPVLGLTILWTFGVFAAVPPGSYDAPGTYIVETWIGAFLFLYPAAVIWPLWPLTKRVTFTPVKQTLRVGLRLFDLKQVDHFDTEKKSYKPGKFAEFVTFDYGRRTIKIRVSNPPEHSFRIACHMAGLQKDILSGAIHPNNVEVTPESERREAAF